MNSKMVYGLCGEHLNEIADRYDVHIMWVPPGHIYFPCNSTADELVRCGTTIVLFIEFYIVGTPLIDGRFIIENLDIVKATWSSSDY